MKNSDFSISLDNAEKYYMTADHLLGITFRLVNEKKIFLNVLENLGKAALYGIDSALKFEESQGNIRISQASSENLEIFKQTAGSFSIGSEDLRTIDEILGLLKKHKESPMEFVKGDNVIVMSDKGIPVYLDFIKVKNYSVIIRSILNKIRKKISG